MPINADQNSGIDPNVDQNALINGDHLLICEEFKCAAKYFKCPGYYCIPWRYVCNAIWDCPGGLEETECSNRKVCPGQFKCYNSSICLDRDSLCDNVKDCIHGDDEVLCGNGFSDCLTNCTCFLYSISCRHGNRINVQNVSNLPFVVTFMSNFQNVSLESILLLFQKGILFILPYNDIHEICITSHKTMSWKTVIQLLDISHNSIYSVKPKCFEYSNSIIFLNISFNNLSEITKHAFIHLRKLKTLDASFNRITHLDAFSFYGLQKITSLNLTNNAISEIDFHSLTGSVIRSLVADSNKLCCITKFNSRTKCITPQKTESRCIFRLLNSPFLPVIMTFSFSLILFSTPAIFLNALNIGGLDGYNSRSINNAVALGNIFLGISLLIIAINDIVYDKSYIFHDNHWRQSFLCFSCGTFILFHSMTSLYILNLMAVSSLRIVTFPFDSNFLENFNPTFVFQQLLLINLLCFMLAASLVVLHFLTFRSLPYRHCLMLGGESVISFTVTIGKIILNVISLFSLPYCYHTMYIRYKESELLDRKHVSSLKVKHNIYAYRNHPSLLSETALLFFALIWKEQAETLLIWYISVVLMTNSITSPFILKYRKIIHKTLSRARLAWSKPTGHSSDFDQLKTQSVSYLSVEMLSLNMNQHTNLDQK